MGQPLLDKNTHSLVTIDYSHHEIHSGDHFNITNFSTIGSGIGSSLFFSVQTPNNDKWVHMTYTVQGNLVTTTKLWEDSTLSGGTLIQPINNNRNSSNVSDTIIRFGAVISGATPTSGTLISARSFGLSAGGGANKTEFGGEINRDNEIILKSGTYYLIQITSATADNLITYHANWYEHSNLST